MRSLLALAGTAMLFVGCARMEVIDDGLAFEQRQAALDAIPNWNLRGGIAVDDGDRAYQARFSWQQRADEIELVVRSRIPGTRSFRIAGDEESLTVESRGETAILTDPEAQLEEMLGWWLPVTSAEHWLLGQPDPDYPSQSSRGSFDTLQHIDQRDWQISFDEYQIAQGRLIPRRMTLTAVPLELTIRILEWESVADEP